MPRRSRRYWRFDLADTPLAAEGEEFVLVTFVVIVATVTIYGLALGPLALRLGLASADPQGLLFVGASPVVRAIAEAVRDEGFSTLLVDTNQENVAAARMAGLPVCFASIGSEFVREETDFGDIGRLLAMTPNDEVNTLAALEFSERFGRADVYQLAAPEVTHQRRDRVAAHRRGRALFRRDATYGALANRFDHGALVKKTLLTADFTFDDFRARYGDDALVLFTVDDTGKLAISTPDGAKAFKAGHKLIALVNLPTADYES